MVAIDARPVCPVPRARVRWKQQRAWGSQILTTSHPRQMPKYGRAPVSPRAAGSPSLSSESLHQLSQCEHPKAATPSLLCCLLLPDRFSPFGLQASFPFLTPAVTRGVITSKINFAGLKRKPALRDMKGLAEWAGGDWCQCLVRSADPLHKCRPLLQEPFSAALCKQIKPTSLLTRSLQRQGNSKSFHTPPSWQL